MQTTPIDSRFHEVQELAEVCKAGDLARAAELLLRHPEVLDSPDYDTRFDYPGSCLWSPLGLAASHGHLKLVEFLLDKGANPVPYEYAAQYHQQLYEDWTQELRHRGYDLVADAIEGSVTRRYGPRMEGEIRQAVRDGDVERVRALITENPERVQQADLVGNSALHLATAWNQIDIVRVLLDNGAPVDVRNGSGRMPSVVALFGFHRWWRDEEKLEILDLLRKHGAEYTMLIAATLGDEARVRELLLADPSSANAADACWRRPLSCAVSKGHTGIVRLLLEHGADPNAKEVICQGGLSLHEAAENGYLEIAEMLLEKGATPEHWVDSSGDCVYAAREHPEILHLLYSYGATMELQVYSAAHRIDVIAEVLKLDPLRANDVLPYGWDDNGSEDLACHIMRLAIRYGARFEHASEWKLRWTALKYPKVYRLLLAHGANPDLSLLAIAGDMRRGRYKGAAKQIEVIDFLVSECGANVHYKNDEGMTPLAAAAREGYLDLVEYLLAKGADPNPDAPDWAKPLRLAEQRGHQDVAKLLRG